MCSIFICKQLKIKILILAYEIIMKTLFFFEKNFEVIILLLSFVPVFIVIGFIGAGLFSGWLFYFNFD